MLDTVQSSEELERLVAGDLRYCRKLLLCHGDRHQEECPAFVLAALALEVVALREQRVQAREACRDFRHAWAARPSGMTPEAMALRTVLKREVEDILDAMKGGSDGG